MSQCPICPRTDEHEHRLCARCYDEMGPADGKPCSFDPSPLVGIPLGMFHCPHCGGMVIAGQEHGLLCNLCAERRHPLFDEVQQ